MAAFAVLRLVCSTAACAAPGHYSSIAVYAVPGHIWVSLLQYSSLYSILSPEVSVLQQLVVHLDCLSTRASAAPRRVCLQELLCAPEVSADHTE
jgi:hypothetical protein